ncbi:hypothetical protein ACFQ1R_11160 [Mariniflexile jejuense]|uniref:DKNYY family protein n=1 Tax=Mariniflexile jejuense TaxID=1173582 RepID=A0ABW3JJJ9_9FLAO
MKKNLLLFLCFAFAEAYTAKAQVYIDKVNAPVNPIGPYYNELAAKNIKGSVYIVDYSTYPRNGKRNYTTSSYSLQDAIKNKWEYYETQNGLLTVTKTAFYDKATTYKYDTNKCIIYEENDFWIHNYSYDTKKRLIETTSYNKAKKATDKTQYSYYANNDLLVVTGNIKNADGISGTTITQFKNGLLISSAWNDEMPIRREYVFDTKGNWINEKVINPRYMTTNTARNIVYYEDIDLIIKNKKLDWEKQYFLDGSDVVLPYAMIRNEPVKKQLIGTRTIDNGVLFFIDKESRYYYGTGAFLSNHDKGIKGTAFEIASGYESLLEYNNGSISLYDNGLLIKNFKHHYYGESYYLTDSTAQRHFIVQDYKSSNGFYPAKTYVNNPVVYGHNPEKGLIKLFINGEEVKDYSDVKWKYSENGDHIAVKNNNPLYVLTGTATNTVYKLYIGKQYNGEKILDNNPLSKKETAIAYSPALPVVAKKLGDTSFEFYQNNNLITNPRYFIITADNENMLLGYGFDDFVFYNYKSIPTGTMVNTTKVAKENEVVLLYKNGILNYIYNNGTIISNNDMSVLNAGESFYLIYLKKLNKTIKISRTTLSKDVKFQSATTYSNNDWIDIAHGKAVIFSNGKVLDSNSYKIHVDAGRNAHIYINNKPVWYVKNYGGIYQAIDSLLPHTGQPFTK